MHERDSGAYWLVAFALCVLGIVGLFSFGAPLLLLGVSLLAVSPWRTKRTVLWPTVAGVTAFVFAYLLTAPLGCTVEASRGAQSRTAGRTVCTNLVGIDYSGMGAYQPNLAPAAAIAFGAAFVVALVARRALRGSSQPAF